MTEKEKKEPTEKYILKEVVTQKDTAIGIEGNDEVFTEQGLLLEILNKLDKIEKVYRYSYNSSNSCCSSSLSVHSNCSASI